MSALSPDLHERSNTERQLAHSDAVRAMFNRISPTYDVLNDVLSLGICQSWRRHAVKALQQLPDGPLLDVCAGTLDISLLLKNYNVNRKIISTDFAANMLRAGQKKMVVRSCGEIDVCDAQQLPFRDATIAGAICGFGVRNVSDAGACIREAFRVLKPGGMFSVLEFFRPTRVSSELFHSMYGRVVLPAVGRWISGDTEAYKYLSQSMRGFLTRGEFESILKSAGFVDVHGKDLTFAVASIVTGRKPLLS